MKIELKDLEVGDKVWCGGDSGFCQDDIEKVEKIEWKFTKELDEYDSKLTGKLKTSLEMIDEETTKIIKDFKEFQDLSK